jgi:signal transduction histidine kinase
MTIRRKFNIAMLLMLTTSLVIAAVVIRSVRTITNAVLSHAATRELSVFTDDVRAEIFYQTAIANGLPPLRENDWWPEDLLIDIDVRIHHAVDDVERRSWNQVHDDVTALANVPHDDPRVVDLVRSADFKLRSLRRHYDQHVATAVAQTAQAASLSEWVVIAASVVSLFLFAIVTLLIRDWFVKPIAELNDAADAIGDGNLNHKANLKGRDELAQLGRRINEMAEKLAEHQKQLIESREFAAIGEVCTNVAHGLRNPLAGLRAGAQLATRRLNDPEKLKPMLDDIMEEVDRMDHRITRLFDFSKMVRLNKSPVRFAELVADAKQLAGGVMNAKEITLDIVDDTRGGAWMLDPRQIASAVGELITNAAHHSPVGATIHVTGRVESNGAKVSGAQHSDAEFSGAGYSGVSHGAGAGCGAADRGEALVIDVVDHGPGIPPQVMPRLFELYFTTRENGAGLGLPLIQRIIKQHGGSIDISSEPGSGVCARVTLR